MTRDLFDSLEGPLEGDGRRETLGEGSVVLRGFARVHEAALLADLATVVHASPFRTMTTPGGYRMSVGLTSCGSFGWVSDASGYRYDALDPSTGRAWPAMPDSFRALATRAADAADFDGFDPDSCLVNRYAPGARLSMHQDRNERSFEHPIVSVSLGIPATFLFGGLRRADRSVRVALRHGDVVVWGGADRLRFHGVMPLEPGDHARLGPCRINLTFRRAR